MMHQVRSNKLSEFQLAVSMSKTYALHLTIVLAISYYAFSLIIKKGDNELSENFRGKRRHS